MSELRIRLSGPEAELGRIPARDVAHLILQVERAVARAASAVLGRPRMTSGRREAVVARAARFRLRGIEEGSVIPVLELPEPVAADAHTPPLELDAATLTESALACLFNAAEGDDGSPVAARAVLDLADALRIGERYESVTFDYRSGKAIAPRIVAVDGAVRKRLRTAAGADDVAVREDTVVGRLVEADFENHTARLRGPLNEAVEVTFDDVLADEIYHALRQQATLQGQITYDPHTLAARSVRLQQITRGRQLLIDVDPEAFWLERSFDELARDQGARAVDPEELYSVEASEEEREAFMAALDRLAG